MVYPAAPAFLASGYGIVGGWDQVFIGLALLGCIPAVAALRLAPLVGAPDPGDDINLPGHPLLLGLTGAQSAIALLIPLGWWPHLTEAGTTLAYPLGAVVALALVLRASSRAWGGRLLILLALLALADIVRRSDGDLGIAVVLWPLLAGCGLVAGIMAIHAES